MRTLLSAVLKPRIDKMKKIFQQLALIVCLLCAVGCTTPVSQISVGKSPITDQLPSAGREQSRITDGVIRADLKYFASLQTRLAALNAKGRSANDYSLSKATAWLEFAQEEYTDNDRSGIVERLLVQALILIQKMERGNEPIDRATLIVEGSQRIRADLWGKLEAFHQHVNFDCVQGKVAQAEVQLVWAGHEELEGGWRHSKPYIEIAEAQVADIEKGLKECAKSTGPVPPVPPITQVPTTVTPPVLAKVAEVERIVLSTDTLFKFNKSSLEDLAPSTKLVLETFVQALRQHRSIEKILITGHTDRLGTPTYNLKLSEARAAAIAQYLIDKGFAKDVIQVAGAGESDPLTTCSGNQITPELQACLQPNRRVEVRVRVTP
jgi:OmpA-OmpF porin, OOP family